MSVMFLEGLVEEELDFNFRDVFLENCGLAAAINLSGASYVVGQMVPMIEKRGERGGGVVSRRGGKLHHRRRVGPFSVQFRTFDKKRFDDELPGRAAIAHCRYATKGDPEFVANVQPLTVIESKYGPFAIAHNGTLVNAEPIKKRLVKAGCAFHSTSDTEILIHLILDSEKKTIEEAIRSALTQVEASYSLLIISRDKVFAIRDRFGVRPLSIAKMGEGYLVCSETVAFDQFPGAEYWRDVEPGEMVVFSRLKKECYGVKYAEANEMFCIFESIYFSNPRSRKNGFFHEDFRFQIGVELARDVCEELIREGSPPLVAPVLDSGKHFAEGVASGIASIMGWSFEKMYKEVFQRAHGPLGGQARSFTSVTTEERIAVVLKKLNLRKDEVVGRTVVVVDDSIVRSNTIKVIVDMLKRAGAAKIIVVVGFPPIVNICPNGMDFQTRKQIVAFSRTTQEIKELVGCDVLMYLRVEDLLKIVKSSYNCGICGGCFGWRYPIVPSNIKD